MKAGMMLVFISGLIAEVCRLARHRDPFTLSHVSRQAAAVPRRLSFCVDC